MARSNLVPLAFKWKKLKKSIFSVTVVLLDLKIHSDSTPKKF